MRDDSGLEALPSEAHYQNARRAAVLQQYREGWVLLGGGVLAVLAGLILARVGGWAWQPVLNGTFLVYVFSVAFWLLWQDGHQAEVYGLLQFEPLARLEANAPPGTAGYKQGYSRRIVALMDAVPECKAYTEHITHEWCYWDLVQMQAIASARNHAVDATLVNNEA